MYKYVLEVCGVSVITDNEDGVSGSALTRAGRNVDYVGRDCK